MNKIIDEIKTHLNSQTPLSASSNIEIMVKESIPDLKKITTSTDISSWFSKDPNEHIRIISY